MASEIRVDKINSLSGVGTVTLSPTGVDIAGITTAATLRATTGIVTSLTAGSLTSLGAVSGTTGTFSGAVSGTTGTFSSDVKSTAGIVDIRSGSSINTNVTGSSSSGTLHKNTTSGEFAVVSGGTGGNNHLSFYTSASAAPTEKVRIDSNGRVLIGTTTEGQENADDLTVAGSDNSGITIRSGTSSFGQLFFSDGTSGDDEYRGIIGYSHTDNFMKFHTNAVERLRIDSSGRIGIGEDNPTREVVIKNSSGNCQLSITSGTSNSAYLNLGDTDDDNIGSIYYSNSDNRIVFRVNTTDTVRMESDGNIRILDGDLRVATAGHGIDFSATSDASGMTNELLDDYEEGTFTPSFAYGLVASSYEANGQKGAYTKIGRYVYGTILLHLATASTQDGNVIDIHGLPFTSLNHTNGQAGGLNNFYQDGFFNSNDFSGIVGSANTQVRLYVKSTGAYLTGSSVNGGKEIRCNFWYHAA